MLMGRLDRDPPNDTLAMENQHCLMPGCVAIESAPVLPSVMETEGIHAPEHLEVLRG